MKRRVFLAGVVLGAAALATCPGIKASPVPAGQAGTVVDVWKSPECGCCEGWMEHMRAAGFTLRLHEVEDVAGIKAMVGVPDDLASCHTSLVGGYVLEGHVPAGDVRRLLAERPDALGIAVAGMPADAPGMDLGTGEPFDVVLFDARGAKVFARH